MRSESVSAFEKEWSGIFFAILKDVKVAGKSYNRAQDWQTAPSAPLGLARFTVDPLTLQQQTTISNAFQF
jgi:hypothetical protein